MGSAYFLSVGNNSKESVQYLLKTLWKTRKTGLDSHDRAIIKDMFQLPTDAQLDPLLVCLRMLIRKCVDANLSKEDIPKLFPPEVMSELQKLLTVLLQKFQGEWRADVIKEKVSLPRLKAMACNVAKETDGHTDRFAVISLKLQDDNHSLSEEGDVKFQISKASMGTMMKSLCSIRDHLMDAVC